MPPSSQSTQTSNSLIAPPDDEMMQLQTLKLRVAATQELLLDQPSVDKTSYIVEYLSEKNLDRLTKALIQLVKHQDGIRSDSAVAADDYEDIL